MREPRGVGTLVFRSQTLPPCSVQFQVPGSYDSVSDLSMGERAVSYEIVTQGPRAGEVKCLCWPGLRNPEKLVRERPQGLKPLPLSPPLHRAI